MPLQLYQYILTNTSDLSADKVIMKLFERLRPDAVQPNLRTVESTARNKKFTNSYLPTTKTFANFRFQAKFEFGDKWQMELVPFQTFSFALMATRV